MEPLVRDDIKYVNEFHTRLNRVWQLLRKIGGLFDYQDFDPKGRVWMAE